MNQLCVKVRSSDRMPGHESRCGVPGKVQRDGVWWCRHHDPKRLEQIASARAQHMHREDGALAEVERVEGEIDQLVERHPDFQILNSKLRAAKVEYRKIYYQRSKVALREFSPKA